MINLIHNCAMNNVVLLLGIFIATLGLTQTSSGLTLGMSSEKILEIQQLILLGTVDSVETRSGDTEYDITVLEYVKIPAGFNKVDTLHVVGCGEGQIGGCITFDEGQDVLFILDERNNKFQVSELSFVSPNPNCTINDLFRYNDEKYDGLSLYQDSKNNRYLYTNQPIIAQYYYFNKNLEVTSVDVTIKVVDDFPDILKEETIRLDLDECQPNAKAEMEFVIDSPGSFAISAKVEGNGGGEAISGVKVIDYVVPPLKQFKSGIPIDEIQCKEGLELILKSSDGSPVCVTYSTGIGLIERGWGTCEGLDYGRGHPCGPRSSGVVSFSDKSDPTDISRANNQFAIKFYSEISQENDDNVFFSPASIFTAFAIAYEGAQGNTAKEMEGVFGFEPDDSARHEGLANMQQRLNFEGQNNTLSIANALWLAKNFEPYSDYVNNVENYYSGKVDSVDFASKEKSLDIINQWVHDNTGGKIEKIFETLDPDTKLAITNAIYFKGIWEEPFEKDRTAIAPFHVRDGLTVSVPMMELKTTYLNQTKTPTARILELPYEGSKISMLILLPNEIDGIRALEDSLSAENIATWEDDYTKIKTKAYIPKFKLETDYDLIPPLIDLGVHDAFGNADFSGISALDLFIYKVKHKAIVEVNEEGTEAAAATGMAMLQSGPVEFRADHPFVFVIQDNETGQILFMGRVTDPTK